MTTKASEVTAPEKATSKPASPKRTRGKKDETPYVPPKKLSKAALWRRANPGGVIEIVDMRAVMK